MTPEQLLLRLGDLLPVTVVSSDSPEALLAPLEAAAEARPADRDLAALVEAATRMSQAGSGLPRSVAGVRRETLIRWDAVSSTWVGPGPDGRTWMVRVLRPSADLPLRRRALLREARALSSLLPEIKADGPALAVPAPGQPLDEPIEVSPARAARLLGTGLAHLRRLETLGMGLPALSPHELRALPDRVAPCCLTPVAPQDTGPAIAQLAAALQVDGEGEVARLLAGLQAMAPRTAADAADALRAALTQDLARLRHDLWTRQHATASARRHARLAAMVHRLQAALPPPVGQGAIGVDFDGRITAVRSDGRSVRWGPADDLAVVWSTTDGFDAPLARRLLRTRATGRPTDRMHRTVEGSEAQAEALGRWIAAGLRLRTVRLLLDKAPTGDPLR